MADPITLFVDPGATGANGLAVWQGGRLAAWDVISCHRWHPSARAVAINRALQALDNPIRDVAVYVEAQYLGRDGQANPKTMTRLIESATAWRVVAAGLGCSVASEGTAPSKWQATFGLLSGKPRPKRDVIAARALALVRSHIDSRVSDANAVSAILGALHHHLPRLDDELRREFAWVDALRPKRRKRGTT